MVVLRDGRPKAALSTYDPSRTAKRSSSSERLPKGSAGGAGCCGRSKALPSVTRVNTTVTVARTNP